MLFVNHWFELTFIHEVGAGDAQSWIFIHFSGQITICCSP